MVRGRESGEKAMKKVKKIILLLLALMLVGASTVSAQSVDAVYAYNSAEIDWSNLSISGDSLTKCTWSGSYYSKSMAYATDSWGVPTILASPPYQSDSKVTAGTSASLISGSVDDSNFSVGRGTTTSTISAAAEAEVSVPGDAFSADSLAQRGQVYYLNSGATFNFSIPYQLVSQSHGVAMAENLYGYVRAWLLLRVYDSTTRRYEQIGKLDMQYFEDFALPSDSGNLSFSYTGTAGQYILLEAGVDALSAVQKDVVPIPGAAWLLLSGLLGLVGVKRFGKDS